MYNRLPLFLLALAGCLELPSIPTTEQAYLEQNGLTGVELRPPQQGVSGRAFVANRGNQYCTGQVVLSTNRASFESSCSVLQACSPDALASCPKWFGLYRRNGERVAAAQVARIACEGGVPHGCSELARLILLKQTYGDAAVEGKKSCDRSEGEGCRLAAMASDTDVERGPLLASACALGDIEGCMRAARNHVLHDRFAEEVQSLRAACALGRPQSCNDAGVAMLIQNSRDSRGWKLLEQACAQGVRTSCRAVAAHAAAKG